MASTSSAPGEYSAIAVASIQRAARIGVIAIVATLILRPMRAHARSRAPVLMPVLVRTRAGDR